MSISYITSSASEDGMVTNDPEVDRDDDQDDKDLYFHETGDHGLMKLSTVINRLLSALADNQLTSFR